MLDKDKHKIDIPLECGCVFSLTDYFTSGFQCSTEEEHLLYKYGIILYNGLNDYCMNQAEIRTWDKIKDMIDIDKLCSGHFFAIIDHIVKGTYEYYPKQREYMNKIIQSIENNKHEQENKSN